MISISVFFLFAFDIQAIQVGTPQIYWDPPIKISGPAVINNIDLVVDKQGVAHFFWDEGSQEDGGEDSVIYYRNYDGDQLSTPVDILITPETGQANTPSVCLDTNNMVHIVWIGNSGLWYSNTYMDQAADVHSWKTPIMLASPVAAAARASIICSPDGSLHLAYIVFRQFADIYYTQSIDGGNDWTIPTNVSLSGDTTIGPVQISMCVNSNNQAHIVWQDGELANGGWPGHHIYYSRQTGDYSTWSHPGQIDVISSGEYVEYGPFTPSIICNADRIHIIWDGSPQGERHHRFSNDDGRTWIDNGRISEFRGITYQNALSFDNDQNLHMASGSLDDRLRYMVWFGENNKWTELQPIDQNVMGPHYPRMLIQNGDTIHVVWNEVKNNEFWYRRGRILSLSNPPIPTAKTTNNDISQELLFTGTPENEPQSTPTPTQVLDVASFQNQTGTNSKWNSSINLPIVVSVIPIIILLVVLFLWKFLLK